MLRLFHCESYFCAKFASGDDGSNFGIQQELGLDLERRVQWFSGRAPRRNQAHEKRRGNLAER